MKDPIYEKLMTYLQETKMPLYRVAREAKIGQATISRIFNGKCKNPRIQTAQALIDFFERQSAVPLVDAGGHVGMPDTPAEVCEHQKDEHNTQAGKQQISPGVVNKWDAIRARALGKKTIGQPENA